MRKFKHISPGSVEEAAAILKEHGGKAKIIAGGTDLLGEMKDDILPEYPQVLVNIKAIPGMDYIKEEGGKLCIGALTRLEDIASDKTVTAKYPALAEAAGRTASPHIREMGTIAGNICQNNRCWYYWVPDNRFNCLRKGGKVCYALIGDGRYHSIFGSTRVDKTPCTKGCPDNIDIPSYMDKIRDGKLAEAAEILLNNNPIPSITGRVCPHFCEAECNRGEFDQPVSIRGVERHLGDYALENAKKMYKAPVKETGKKAAVIGSGPAGLAAAYYLRRCGHDVTVFDKMEEAGGLLMYGIPPYRLPKSVVRRQVKALEGTGIKFSAGTEVDRDKFKEIAGSFDAVFIACGAWKERAAGITGEQYLLSGAEFLMKSNLGAKEVPGKKVGVIGGGNVAIDVARSLLRLGVEPVIIYRRTAAEMPALKDEVVKAQEEGIKIEFLTQPLEASQKSGKVVLKCIRMRLGAPDETGRPRPVAVKGSEFTMQFDAVMKAIGEGADTSFLPDKYTDKSGGLKIDEAGYALGNGVFAGGDFVTGPATVVAAIAAGRIAAGSIDAFLQGKKVKEGEKTILNTAADRFNSTYLKKTVRTEQAEVSAAKRVKTPDTEELSGLEKAGVAEEANRCFNCGCVAVNPSDMATALVALDAEIKTSRRVIAADEFFAVGIDRTTVLGDDEIVTEIRVPKLEAGTKTKFIKLALRKSIDFPVVNCAAAVVSKNGTVKSARICLNSVYNVPMRMSAAEEYITGKKISEASAEGAASTVVIKAFPVVNNKYKIQIARTLVKRAILACGE